MSGRFEISTLYEKKKKKHLNFEIAKHVDIETFGFGKLNQINSNQIIFRNISN